MAAMTCLGPAGLSDITLPFSNSRMSASYVPGLLLGPIDLVDKIENLMPIFVRSLSRPVVFSSQNASTADANWRSVRILRHQAGRLISMMGIMGVCLRHKFLKDFAADS